MGEREHVSQLNNAFLTYFYDIKKNAFYGICEKPHKISVVSSFFSNAFY